MKESINSLRTIHVVCYIISILTIVALFFTNKWEMTFYEAVKPNPFTITYGLTVNRLVLGILNISMLVSILSPLKNEDERAEKIKNYVFVHTFILAIIIGLFMGLLINVNTSLLIYIAIIQAYYIMIFHICLYRDSSMVYMDKEQLTDYTNKINKHFKINYIRAVLSAIIIYILVSNGRYDLLGVCIIGLAYIIILLQTIYMHWKN